EEPDGHLTTVRCLSFSPDGSHLLSGSDDGTLLIWDVETGKIRHRLKGHHGFVTACAYLSRDRVVSGGWGGEVFVWDLRDQTARPLGNLSVEHSVLSLGVRQRGPGGADVIAGTEPGRVIAWDVATGEERMTANDDLARASGTSGVLA